MSEHDHKLPGKVDVAVAFQAMVHFLALHWLQAGPQSLEIRDFISSISNDWDGPASPEIMSRFREAAEDAWNREEPARMMVSS